MNKQMTPRERLQAALNRQPVDRVPILIPGGMMAGVLYDIIKADDLPYPGIHTDTKEMVRYAKSLQQKCQLDNTGVPFCMTVEAEAFGAGVDLGNDLHEPSIIREPYSDIQTLLAVEPRKTGRQQTVLDSVAVLSGKDVPVIGNVTGPMSLLTSLVQQGIVFRAMAKQDADLPAAFSKLGDYISQFAEELIEQGADIIVIADPSAAGEIIGPEYFQQYLYPVYRLILERIHAAGCPVILHICGRIFNLVPVLKDLDWNGLSVDSLVSLKKLNRELAGRVLMGNVSTLIMARSSEEKTYRASRRIVETTAILSPACGLSTRTPISNIKAMVAAAEDAANGLIRNQ